MLSDEKLRSIYHTAWLGALPNGTDDTSHRTFAALRAVAEAAVQAEREPAPDGSDYKTKLVFTKHDMDREAARLGALIELHMDDSTKLLKMLGVCNDTKENDHWRYRKECFVDFDKVSAVQAEREGAVEVAACCGRRECGGECGNEWRGMTSQHQAVQASATVDETCAAIIRAACETDPADPDHADTICISVGDLKWILSAAIEDSATVPEAMQIPAHPADACDVMYAEGWNSCRAAMLAASQPDARKAQGVW